MSIKLAEKIEEMKTSVIKAFEGEDVDHVLVEARKSGEALCKAIILRHYGEDQGSKIILGQEDKTGSTLKAPKDLSFENIKQIVFYDKEPHTIIKNKTTRERVKGYLKIITTNGNSSAHNENDRSALPTLAHMLLTSLRVFLYRLISEMFCTTHLSSSFRAVTLDRLIF